jgi:hypothetical protein
MLRTLLALLLLAAARPAFADMTGLVEGTLGDTGYLIGKHDNWNGGLILFAHGYEGEREGRGSLGESYLTAHFKRGNYAWAAAGFRSAGYRPDWFLVDTIAVRQHFINTYGQPRWVILYGGSMDRRRTLAAGTSRLLVQRSQRMAAHCDFDQSAREKLFDDLVAWIERGVVPAGEDLLGDVTKLGGR